ncbi:MAG TPA: aldo/keto reductase [Candidatus Nanopelagicales bacterium]|jgi:diketogulonate reductase-like aldo/keto reductase
MTAPTLTMADGAQLPAVGFGTYPLKGPAATNAVLTALGAGYRLVDTAVNYRNETEVGEALARSTVAREQVVVTTKLPGRDHGYEQTLASFEGSRTRLGVATIDLYLIHWPNPSVDRYVDSWRAMVELRDRGLVRSIGVSNFTEAHLTRLGEEVGVLPAVNQVELHPRFPQERLRKFHAAQGILTESWSPLGRAGDVLAEPAVAAPARALGVTPAQVVLRWQVQLGSVPIPKSADPVRQAQNLDIFGFELTEEQVAAITALGRSDGRLFGADPDHHEEQ